MVAAVALERRRLDFPLMSVKRAEYVIVGGGVYGVATAWYLARRGAEVVVLEAETVASGASGGLGKRGVRANGRDLRELPIMRLAHEIWPSLEAELGAALGWERVGHLRLYERPHDIGAAEARARVQSEFGIPTRHLGHDEIQELEPGVSDAVMGALQSTLDGVADHGATTRAYAARALEAGVEIREGARVRDLRVDAAGVTGAVLDDDRVLTPERGLLLLCNAGVPTLVERAFGRALPVWTVFPQALRTSPAAEAPFRSLFGHTHRPLAAKMLPDRSVMLSGGWRGRWNGGLGRGEVIQASVEGNWAEALAVFPDLASLQVVEARADRAETVCVDDVPIIDRMPEAPEVVVACGWSGHGWAMAPALAPMLADWVLDGARPELIRPFGLERFRGRVPKR